MPPFTNPVPQNLPCLSWPFLPRQTRIHQQELTFTGLRLVLSRSWWVLAKHFLDHLQHLCTMISATTSQIWHTTHQKASSFSIFFFEMFWRNSVNFSYQQNRLNRSGYRFLWLNRRFPVIFDLIWFSDFEAYSDRTAYRFTIEPVQPAGPIRFLKPWKNFYLENNIWIIQVKISIFSQFEMVVATIGVRQCVQTKKH